MVPYADSNFLGSLYLETIFNRAAEKCVERARAESTLILPLTDLLQVEVTNALHLHVFISHHGGPQRITWEMAAVAFSRFEEDIAGGTVFATSDLSLSDLRNAAIELSLRHTATRGFRTYDVMHVASAILLGCDTFWSFDANARKLAQLEGLAVNPLD